MRLMGLEASKAIHQITVCEAGKANISCIGWTCNRAKKAPSGTAVNAKSWERIGSSGLDVIEKKTSLNLPRELTFLEVETSLPKLSPLPASGGSGYVHFFFDFMNAKLMFEPQR